MIQLLVVVLGTVILTVTSCSPKNTTLETPNQEPLVEEPVPVAAGIDAMYAEYTLEDMMTQADAIFIGEVTAILPPRWNQDSGEYWEGAGSMQVHQLEVAISQSLVDVLGLGEKVTITLLGTNPVRMEDKTIDVAGGSPHALEVGNQGAFFVVRDEFPWRDGTRPTIGFLGNPKEGYLLPGSDGFYYSTLVPDGISLDDLMNQITENRK